MQADNQGCCLIVTTGGTGPSPRDVTPEATEAVCSRMLPGYGEQMRAISLKYVPTAVLSRQTAGARVWVGSAQAAATCLVGAAVGGPHKQAFLLRQPLTTCRPGLLQQQSVSLLPAVTRLLLS